MNSSLLSPLLLAGATLSLAADFEVRLVQATANADLPRSVPQEVQPMNSQNAATLAFLITGENIVEVDQKSLKLETGGKWEVGFFNKVSEDGTYALVNLSTKKELLGKLDDFALKGTIKIVTGSDFKAETLTLTDGADATQVGDFSVRYKGEKKDTKKKGFGFNMSMGPGIEVKGDLAAIKSIVVKINGEEETQNGYSSMNKTRTYQFDGLKGETAEVVFTYWTDLQEVTVPLEK